MDDETVRKTVSENSETQPAMVTAKNGKIAENTKPDLTESFKNGKNAENEKPDPLRFASDDLTELTENAKSGEIYNPDLQDFMQSGKSAENHMPRFTGPCRNNQ